MSIMFNALPSFFLQKSASETGSIFANGGKLLYQDFQVREFTVDIEANSAWDRIFSSQPFTSNIPYGNLPSPNPGDQMFTDITLQAKLIESVIPYAKLSSIEFLAGYSEDGTDSYMLGVACKSSTKFQVKGLAVFRLSVWRG